MNKNTLLNICTGVLAGLVTIGISDLVMAKRRDKDIKSCIKAFNYIMKKIADGDYPDNDVDKMFEDYEYFHKLENQFKS